MKARTSGSGRTGCKAVQYSDQMHCAQCGLVYDVNDPDPPDCAPLRRAIKPLILDQNGPKSGKEILEKLGL